MAREPAVPHVHAAVARRRGVLRADRHQGRHALRAPRGSTRPRCCETIEEQKIDSLDAGADDALRADGPPGLADPRPVVAGDRLLRRLRDQPGAPQGGDRAVRPDLRAVLRPVRGADGDHLLPQGRPRRRRRQAHRVAADVVRPPGRVPAHRAARRGRPAGAAGRAGGDLRRRTAARRRLLAAARADRRDLPRRLDAHRRRRPGGRGRLLVHRRPHQGHDRHRRLQRLPARGRGRRRRAPDGRPGRRHRHAAREVRRGGHRDRRTPPGRGDATTTSVAG